MGINDLDITNLGKWIPLYYQDRTIGGSRVHAEAQRKIDAAGYAFDQMFRSLSAAKANGATVKLLLYYYPYDSGFNCDDLYSLSTTIVDTLDSALQSRANAASLPVIDLRPPFTGHGARSSDAYVFGTDCFTYRAAAGYFIPGWVPLIGGGGEQAVLRQYDPHPNAAGTQAVATAVG